ncbi:SusC/RagA family TonB-linked outer membrane protein [Chryseobacterium sp.]|uniref:SusC/RagA family TonB-linked outer membrane protein n=1 Tax=Chryseobacterium sp. TaxID=1871047 RepID=UPI00333E7A95
MKNLCTAALFFILSGHGLNAQQNLSTMRVSYQAEKMPVPDAIEKFISQTKIRQFSYSATSLEGYFVQPTKCTDEPLMKCLDKLLKELPFEGLIHNNILIIRRKKDKSVSGSKEEIVPSTVVLADTLRPTPNVNKIDEIVVNAGYYAVKDKERTGSISKVSAKDIENQPVTNVLSSLQGRMSGVSITQNSGIPGGGFDIQIRGQNSLRTSSGIGLDGNMPLYIVDGIPLSSALNEFSRTSLSAIPGGRMNPLNSINPNDIESIEVLKDADATAIYGSRGANGVILITTKKGKTGKLHLNFVTNYGISEPISNLKLMNKEQYLQMRRTAYQNEGVTNYPATAYDINGTWNQNNETDWGKTLIGNKSTLSNTQLSLSGGSQNTTFLVSLGHNEQTTAYGHGFKYTSNTINSNLSHHSQDKKFLINFSNIFSNQKNNVVKAEITSQAYVLPPISPNLYNSDGSLNWEGNTFVNPLAAYNASYTNNSKLFQSNINTEYRFFKDLKFKLNAGLNYTSVDELSLLPNTIYNPSLANGASSATSQAEKRNQQIFSFIIEPQLNWHKKWKNHQLELLVGGSFQRNKTDINAMSGTGFESNLFISNISAAKTIKVTDQSSIEYRYAAVFGRINYQYKNKYILNVTGRRDGSSRFGPNNRFANFGAIGAAWLFSNENFLKGHQVLSFGKLRGSYGAAGSDNIGDFQYLDNYTVSPTLIYDNTTALIPSRLYNPNYSWEITKKFEAAIELGFLDNRINTTIAWYRNRSSNQLVGYQLSGVTGFSSVTANLNATVQNTGLEIDVNARILARKDLQWESGFNISFPKNKLLSFPGLEGSPYGSLYVLGSSTQIVQLYQLEGVNPQTRQYQFTDFNKDGKISTPDDRKVIEDLQIKYFGGWMNSLRYKNWELSFLFQFVKKKNYNQNSIIPLPGSMNNQPVEVLNVWSEQNPLGTYMPYSSGNSISSHLLFRGSTAAVSDASFIRLKNLEIGYRIPLPNTPFREVKIYLQGQNLLTWTKFFGADPESLIPGYLPPLRTYLLGASINL